jgi:hypothetical protein
MYQLQVLILIWSTNTVVKVKATPYTMNMEKTTSNKVKKDKVLTVKEKEAYYYIIY